MDAQSSVPTPERPSAAFQIAQAALSAVQQPAFVDALADQVAERVQQRLAQQQCAIPLSKLAEGHVVVEPERTASGKVLVLTQVPLLNSINMCVVVLAKDIGAALQPRIEGKELEPYAMAMYVDKIPGDLRSRTLFSFEDQEQDLRDELLRQLRTLELGSHAFFYMNIVQLPGVSE